MGALHQNEEEGQVRPAPGAVSVQVGAQTHLVAVPAGVEGCGEVPVSAQGSAHAATSPGNTHTPLRVEGTGGNVLLQARGQLLVQTDFS